MAVRLNLIKSTVHFSNWRGSDGSISLSFDVAPEGREYIEIGDEYLFSASSWALTRRKERRLISASLSITTDSDALTNLEPLFDEKDRPICGCATFYPERSGSLYHDAANLHFLVVVSQQLFTEMLRMPLDGPGAATLNVGLTGIEYGWDSSHNVWKLDDSDSLAPARRPITTFSFSVERFWTTESAISDVADRRTSAELAESPDPKHRKLAAIDEKERARQNPDPIADLLRQCRLLLLLILGLGVLAVIALSR